MTALMSQRVVEAVAQLQELHQKAISGEPMTAPDFVRFENLQAVLLHMLHALTGSSHEGEAN